jgi:hypothetical protein
LHSGQVRNWKTTEYGYHKVAATLSLEFANYMKKITNMAARTNNHIHGRNPCVQIAEKGVAEA